MVGTTIIDSNVLIFGESETSPERPLAVAKYKSAMESGRVAINTIIVSEVFHLLRKILGAAEASSRVAALLNSASVDFLDLNRDTVSRAIKLARDFNMDINDALIAQQAIELEASVLTDNVKDFAKIRSVKVIPLRSSV